MNIDEQSMIITDKTITFKNKVSSFCLASYQVCKYCGQNDYNNSGECCYEAGACWREANVDDYIKTIEQSVAGLKCLPPIPYSSSAEGHHLRLDLFHSDLVRVETQVFHQYGLENSHVGNSESGSD